MMDDQGIYYINPERNNPSRQLIVFMYKDTFVKEHRLNIDAIPQSYETSCIPFFLEQYPYQHNEKCNIATLVIRIVHASIKDHIAFWKLLACHQGRVIIQGIFSGTFQSGAHVSHSLLTPITTCPSPIITTHHDESIPPSSPASPAPLSKNKSLSAFTIFNPPSPFQE